MGFSLASELLQALAHSGTPSEAVHGSCLLQAGLHPCSG